MSSFSDFFATHDVKIMNILGDDITISTPGNPVVTIKGVIVNDVEDEELLERFEVDIHTLEILSTDLGTIEADTVISFDGVNYEYLTDRPKGRGRNLIVMREMI